MNYNNISISNQNGISYLIIDRPKKLNALNRETLAEIHQAFEDFKTDEATKIIILTGSGEKAFVAGADISEFANYSVSEGKDLSAKGHEEVFDKIANFHKPVIAAINGFALGGGLELAMAAHLRVASDNAKMGLPETSLGVIPGYGGTQRLPQLVGKGRAMEMIFTAKMIDAKQALQYGLVNHVTTQEELKDFTENLANKITKNSMVAVAQAIEAINANYKDGVNGFEKEIENFGKSFGTEDFKEGTQAFLNKKKPEFPNK
ncbi:enoyl-CoA hydratase/isomerase family protein [Haloflavibacter putidus]|uniref:Enoyl-CoA hydratase n=1 Tax=Haloflavibacter putidus TaxID=2576776 RepID=A0A507ZVV0_9FLAO|nr:enoyl-CoA hydratase-related protein [Haloflavibacter putidus]TQD40593.1 enoyl-CoA hydratase [Haloflavibacter putidus]